jgi:hypothetical protein
MGVITHHLRLTLTDKDNNTLAGSLVIESIQGSTTTVSNEEQDPRGASSYVIAVVLIYGLSIVFLIGSHVFIKKKEESIHGEEGKLVDKYLQNSSKYREITNRETYKKLKTSIVPIVARSPARDLISRRKSFLPFLASAGILIADPGGLMSGLKEEPKPETKPETSEPITGRKISTAVMPIIGEEDEDEEGGSPPSETSIDLDQALRSVERGYSGESYDFAEFEHETRRSRSNSRSDSIERLSKARRFFHRTLAENSMLPQSTNMYKLVWVSGEGSNRSSKSSLYDIPTPIHGSRRTSLASGRWSLGDAPPTRAPPLGSTLQGQGQRSRRASYGVYVQTSTSRDSSSSSPDDDDDPMRITSL